MADDPPSAHAPIPPRFDAVAPFLLADAAAGRFAQWATSTVIDENTREPVLSLDLFDALHRAAGREAAFPVGNAGVVHVYGYWFSSALTPYGYKHERWSDGRLATALGREPTAFLLDDGRDGGPSTPLQRVTDAALPALLSPPRDAIGTAEARVGDARTRVVLLGRRGTATALVYGVDTGAGMRLVTTFPFDGDPTTLLDEFTAAPRLRWNAASPDKT